MNAERLQPIGRHRTGLWSGRMFLVLIAFGGLLLLYGLVPGLLPDAGMRQFFLGLARCYAEHLPDIHCDAIAQPGGYVTVFGLPYVLPVAVLDRLGVPLLSAGHLVEAGYLGLALGGGALLCRRLKMSWPLGLMISALFLASPIVYAQDNYGPLRIGFALLMFYGWVDLALIQRLTGCRTLRRLVLVSLAGGLILTGVRSLALFMDGYSFVMGLMLSAALILPVAVRLLGQRRYPSLVGAALVFSVPTLLAYLFYKIYVDGAVEGVVMPIDFFRGQGVDLFALAVPSSMQWWAAAFGLNHSLTGWMTWSDGPNVLLVYPGWSVLIAAGSAALVFAFGARWDARRPFALAMAATASIALLLALGPSLKVADFRTGPPPDRFIEFSDYLMPASATTLSLGTAALYQSVPGIRNMRAVYRWMLLVKACLLLCGGLLISRLSERLSVQRWPSKKILPRVLVAMLSVFIALESIPNFRERLDRGARHLEQYQAFHDQALTDLRKLELEGSRVLLLPGQFGGDWNHYTANYLCPLAGLKCFNVGGDKSLVQANLNWPMEVRELSRGRWVQGNLIALWSNSLVDEVLVPLFSLRGASYHWPPSERQVEDHLQRAQELAESVGAEAMRHGWFVRLSPPATSEALVEKRLADVVWPVRIDDWGPKSGSFARGFNRQFDGRSALWVRFDEGSRPREEYLLMIGELVLETYDADRILSGRLADPRHQERFLPGHYPVHLYDRATGRTIGIGSFEVVPP